MSDELTTQPIEKTKDLSKFENFWRRTIGFIGADNLSLIFALIVLVLLITVVSPWFGFKGGDKFFSWQNLMNSLAQAIVVVGLLAERKWDRSAPTTALAMVLGNLVIYAFGLAWLTRYVPAERVLAAGMVPFLAGDARMDRLMAFVGEMIDKGQIVRAAEKGGFRLH